MDNQYNQIDENNQQPEVAGGYNQGRGYKKVIIFVIIFSVLIAGGAAAYYKIDDVKSLIGLSGDKTTDSSNTAQDENSMKDIANKNDLEILESDSSNVMQEENAIQEIKFQYTKLATLPDGYVFADVGLYSEYYSFNEIKDEVYYKVYKEDERYSRDRKEILVKNNEIVDSYEKISLPVFSSDKKRIAYDYTDQGKMFMKLDGLTGNGYNDISFRSFSSSDDFYYIARNEGVMYLAKNNTPGQPYDMVNIPYFSSDGQSSVYMVKDGDKRIAVFNEKEIGKEFDSVVSCENGFNQNNEPVFRASKNNEWFIVNGTKEEKHYEQVGCPVFSENKNYYGYMAKENEEYVMVIDGSESAKYDFVHSLVFSPDGQNYAYVAKQGEEQFVVKNGIEGKKYESIYIGSVSINNSGDRIAYVAEQENKVFVVINEIEQQKYDADISDIDTPIFSDNGERIAYLVTQDKETSSNDFDTIWYFAVIDGQETKKYDGMQMPFFTPDNQNIIYTAQEGDKEFVVVNNVENERIFDYVGRVDFNPTTGFISFIARDENDIWLAKLKIDPSYITQKENAIEPENNIEDNSPEQNDIDLKLLDTDKDGLSDYDEINVWQTDLNKSDTDGDGYTDADEVKNGYNPNGEGELVDNYISEQLNLLKKINTTICETDFEATCCLLDDFIGKPASLDSNNIIKTPAGTQAVGEQLLIIFNENLEPKDKLQIISKYEGEIIGCTTGIILQVEFKGVTAGELNNLKELLNAEQGVSVVTFNGISQPM